MMFKRFIERNNILIAIVISVLALLVDIFKESIFAHFELTINVGANIIINIIINIITFVIIIICLLNLARQKYTYSLIDLLLNNKKVELNSTSRYIINRTKRKKKINKYHVKSADIFVVIANVNKKTGKSDFALKIKFNCKSIGKDKNFYYNSINNVGNLPKNKIKASLKYMGTEADVSSGCDYIFESDSTASNNSYIITWPMIEKFYKVDDYIESTLELTWENGFSYNEYEYIIVDPMNIGEKVDEINVRVEFENNNTYDSACLYKVNLKGYGKARKKQLEVPVYEIDTKTIAKEPIVLKYAKDILYLIAVYKAL